jgi:polysaccharide biosynthesis/export protein
MKSNKQNQLLNTIKKSFRKYKYLILTWALLCLTAFSCVPVKRQKYLQDRSADVNIRLSDVKSMELREPVYRLRHDDIISVEVFSLTEEKFNFLGDNSKLELTVDKEGNIELPVVGNIKVEGLTVQEAQDKIKEATVDYLKSPRVSVKLLNFNVTVLGEVEKQGTFNVDGIRINILEVLGQAGGFTDFADRSRVRILRHDQKTANVYTINILEDDLLLTDRFFIQPNDVILVDPLKAKNLRGNISNVTLALSILTALSWLYIRLQ